jgi:hypothetical protein
MTRPDPNTVHGQATPDLARVFARAARPWTPKALSSTADALPSPDAGVDAAVASLVLCSVPDQARALAELQP